MPPRLPDNRREPILADILAGKPRNQIARDHKVSSSTVTRLAHEAGLDDAFDRSSTENATRARVADSRARRAQIAAQMLDDVQRLRERAWSPYEHPMSSPAGPEIMVLSLPPLSEVRNAYTAIGIALDKHVVLERHDADDPQGLAAVDQWLRGMLAER